MRLVNDDSCSRLITPGGTNSMLHVDDYVVAFVVVSESPKTDIP